jgi:hypothetical protein
MPRRGLSGVCSRHWLSILKTDWPNPLHPATFNPSGKAKWLLVHMESTLYHLPTAPSFQHVVNRQ